MKRLLLILGLLGLCGTLGAQTTTTITGTIKDLTQALVTSGKVTFTLQPSKDTTISGLARFSPAQVVCLINASGLIKAQDGVSVCTLTMNTALQPTGTYYRVDLWPYNVKTSSFTFYAVLSTYDWSTVVPTPTTSPAQNFVDIFSNQTIGGNKTWNGANVDNGAHTFNAAVTAQSLNSIAFSGQYASIQAAINAACNGTTPGEVWLPIAGAALSAQITVPNNCSISGFGSALTKLTFTGVNAALFKAASSTPSNIRLHDFWIDGSSNTNGNQRCIDLSGNSPTDITVERLDCSNFGGDGIDLYGANGLPGSRITVNQVHVRNGGLAGVINLYGILVSFDNDATVTNSEVTGAGFVNGIVAFGLPVTSSASAIHNVKINSNSIHDIGQTFGIAGGGIDVGRVRVAEAELNTFKNIGSGGCITFESVWSGNISGNTLDTNVIATQSSILVKQPDTTVSGEVGSYSITVTGNAINQPGGAGQAAITANGAMEAVNISGNTITTNIAGAGGIYIQAGTTDANMVASGWPQGRSIGITDNRITNQAGSPTGAAIHINQPSTQVVDQVEVANNTVRGYQTAVLWDTTSVTDGITHLYVHDNPVEGNTVGLNTGDAHTYNTVYYWNNNPRTAPGCRSIIFPRSHQVQCRDFERRAGLQAQAGHGMHHRLSLREQL
jgi:hypothetical protein